MAPPPVPGSSVPSTMTSAHTVAFTVAAIESLTVTHRVGLGPGVTHVRGGRHGNGRHGDEENQEEGLVHSEMVRAYSGNGGEGGLRGILYSENKNTTRRLGIIRQELPAHLHVVC